MLRWARRNGDERAEAAGRRHLDWVVSRQRANGWFDDCAFKPGLAPSTHGLAYTLRGLLESHVITGERSWLTAVERTAEALILKLEVLPRLLAGYDERWRPTARHACLTGTAQLGGVWLRLCQVTGDPRWLNAGLKAVEEAARHQERGPWPVISGALAGSFPVWGRYAPLQYPNWAAKFLADSIMLYEDCRSGAGRMRAVLVSRYPAFDTLEWKQQVGAGLLECRSRRSRFCTAVPRSWTRRGRTARQMGLAFPTLSRAARGR